jgi:pimeloyl-ACP methyl ester carboxylesterase
LLFYDARGHGASSGRYHTFGYYEKEDGVAALDWLAARTGLERDDVALVGVSYGAATALQMLRLAPDVALVLADSSYTRLIEILRYQANRQFGVLGRLLLPATVEIAEWRADFRMEDVSPTDSVAGHDTPIFLLHSLQDTYTPPSHSEDIFANSNPAHAVLHLTDWGAAHGLSIFVDGEAYEQLFAAFLAEQAPDFGLPVGVP